LRDVAYDYMHKHALSAPLIACLTAETQTGSVDQANWLARLDRLGFSGWGDAQPGADIAGSLLTTAWGTSCGHANGISG
jgi:hypothetical protein